MERILVVSLDSPSIDLSRLLGGAGYEVRLERLGESADLGGADLIVADLRRSTIDIKELVRPLGENAPPVLAALEESELELANLEHADDVVVAPFSEREVLARVRLLLLKAHGELSGDVIRRGDLTIDVANYRVNVNWHPVDLTYKEYELLKFLATNDGKVFTREALLNRVWGYNYYGGARTVDVHIRRIRSKIEVGGRTYIETVRNVGYRFSAL